MLNLAAAGDFHPRGVPAIFFQAKQEKEHWT